ncbi:hypothetical protein B0H66DRAFT_110008 [Apodospora peruviana]|uniref:Arginase n=1 Tax=Apodospora peruviana TaxID=516989 RepID=A0AAE0IHH2_9PEZI|nr:hypothetical protein B0H66DRAFT_110008 [Apodospora peruviana]
MVNNNNNTLKSVTIIYSPFHVGLRGVGPGAGPSFLRQWPYPSRPHPGGLPATLTTLGVTVREIELDVSDDFDGDIGRSFALLRQTSKIVTQELDNGSFPIILAGNCTASVGVAAGICAAAAFKSDDIGCIWFDAHDDFNTPDTIMSGYFDSMPIAMLAGQCWKGLLATMPGYRPLDLGKLVHVGMRDVTDVERQRVVEAGFDVVWGSTEEKVDYVGELGRVLDRKQLGPAMIHIDLDCLGVSLGMVNKFSAPGGLLDGELTESLRSIVRLTKPASLTVASFDPTFEEAEEIADIAVEAIKTFVSELVSAGVLSADQQ